MAPPEIPGYYFDSERNRYFRITNGGLNNGAEVDRYHNNEIQQTKRRKQYLNRRDNYDKNVTDLHQLSLSECSTELCVAARAYYRDQVLNDNIRDIYHVKSGQVNISNPYFHHDRISILRQAKVKEKSVFMSGMMSRGGKVSKLGNGLLIGYQFRDDMFEISVVPAAGQREVIKASQPRQSPLQTQDEAYDDYVTDNTRYSIQAKFQYLSVSFIANRSSSINMFRFATVIATAEPMKKKDEVDHTYKLLKYIHEKAGNVEKVRKMFSLDLVEDHVFDTAGEINYINSILQSDDKQHQAAVRSFLYYHGFAVKPIVFKEHIKSYDSTRTVAFFTSKNEIVFQSLQNVLLIVSYDIDSQHNIEFTDCRVHCMNYTIEGGFQRSKFRAMRDEKYLFKYHNDKFYLPLDNNKVMVLKKSELNKIHNQGSFKVGSDIKKWFIIGDNTIVLVKLQSITMLRFNIDEVDSHGFITAESMDLVKYYSNDNCFQNFLVVKNHLIFNESKVHFIAINLMRVLDGTNITRFKVEFNVNNYYLDNIVDISDDSEAMEIAINYVNKRPQKKYLNIQLVI